MGKLKDKIINFYSSLNIRSKLFFVISIVGVMAILYYLFVNNSYRSNEIDYKNLSSEEIISDSEIVENRIIISEINKILNKFSDIKFDRLYINEKKVTIKELYNVAVTNNYKKSISYKEFSEKFNEIFNNLYQTDALNEEIIDLVYYSAKYDMYLIKFNIKEKDVYIGLKLYLSSNKYSIMFIQ